MSIVPHIVVVGPDDIPTCPVCKEECPYDIHSTSHELLTYGTDNRGIPVHAATCKMHGKFAFQIYSQEEISDITENLNLERVPFGQ